MESDMSSKIVDSLNIDLKSLDRKSKRGLFSVLLVTMISLVGVEISAASPNPDEVEIGRKIYMEGVLPSGELLKGVRQGAVQVEGAQAACETCHRRSGMGSLEGNFAVPPITGRFLFANEDDRPLALVDTRQPKDITRAHKPYAESTLSKAIREGVDVDGKDMNLLMPRYALNDNEVKAVTTYLRQLSSELAPGVGNDSLHFATIITQNVKPEKSDVMVKMLKAAFGQRNSSQQTYSGRMRMPLDLIPRQLRKWELSVWELKGEPETWAEQLSEYYRREPVFAVISGVSNGTWSPVSKFCQQEKIPCLLPSVALPPDEPSFYSLYYSKGVALESSVLANHLRAKDKNKPRRIVQIYRDDEVGRGAVKVLSEALKDSSVKVENRIFPEKLSENLKNIFKGLSSNDTVMLWLKPTDLVAVNKENHKQFPRVIYVSGFLAEEDYGFVSKEWKEHVRVVYPYELGEKRRKNIAGMQQWLKSWSIPLVDQVFQSEVFFDVLLLTDLSSQMIDNFYRDYIVERAEDMLGIGSNFSAYPHLSLSRGQRFASKGAYIGRFGSDGKLVADSEWIVPE